MTAQRIGETEIHKSNVKPKFCSVDLGEAWGANSSINAYSRINYLPKSKNKTDQ